MAWVGLFTEDIIRIMKEKIVARINKKNKVIQAQMTRFDFVMKTAVLIMMKKLLTLRKIGE